MERYYSNLKRICVNCEDQPESVVKPSGKYLSDIKKVYTVDEEVLNKFDWFLLFIGTIGTILCAAAFIWWVFKIFTFIVNVSRGADTIRNKPFWIRMGGAFLIITFFMSGSIYLFVSEIYDLIAYWGAQ
ncbi:hypothetical protein AAXB25_33465 [Paenibacillus lautus]|uniref:hypothetical protein n=1 Tax=Paenibacillus lautus TaxID=1401 RepID=UPI003D2AF968